MSRGRAFILCKVIRKEKGVSKARVVLIIVDVVAMVVAIALVLKAGGKREQDILVLCGGSMRAAMEEIIERYGEITDDKILASYGGSGELCAQIQQTQKGDIYVCHDPFMPWAKDQGLIDTWATVGYLDVAIVVPKGNPKGITGIKDLAKPGIRLGIGNQTYSTSGVIVKHMLQKLEYGDAILKNVRTETKGHQQRCADVAMGALDAGIVWSAVAHLFREKLQTIPIPKEYIDAITSATYQQSDLKNVKVTIGIISYAREKERVRRFYEFATTRGRDIFEKYGFRQ